MSSLVLAPVAAANVLPVWRRSWKRKCGSPALSRASSQTDRQDARRIGWSLLLGKITGDPGVVQVSRCPTEHRPPRHTQVDPVEGRTSP